MSRNRLAPVPASARRLGASSAAILAATALCLALASPAWGLGELTQKPGAAGCLGGSPGDGCGAATAIAGASAVAISPDGSNVYVAGETSNAIAAFDRDPATGALTQGLGLAGCVAWVAAPGCAQGRGLEHPEVVAVSPDGEDVYVAGADTVAIFRRDSAGALIQEPGEAGCISEFAKEGCAQGRGLFVASGIAVSPDGRNVYVASRGSDAVAIFSRDAEGRLTQPPEAAGCMSEDGMDGQGHACLHARALRRPFDLAVTGDGKSLYVASSGSRGVAVFERQPLGNLVQAPDSSGCVSELAPEGCRPGRELSFAEGIAASPDERGVYVAAAGSASLTSFVRETTGALSQKPGSEGCSQLGDAASRVECKEGNGLGGASSVAISPDGRDVYVAALGSDAIASFDRDAAGNVSQAPGPAGCIAQGGGACQQGRGLDGAFDVAISPDGRNVYVASSEPGAIAVFDRAGPPAPPDTQAPTVTGFRVAPTRLSAAPRGRARFRFVLSEPASARIAIERARPGRRVGRRCAAPAPRLSKHRACRRYSRSGALASPGLPAGAAALGFKGKVGGHALAPGAYRATIVATDPAGNASKPRRASFAILPRRGSGAPR
jgi:DNA-binding beta-propeller fold protein YncE